MENKKIAKVIRVPTPPKDVPFNFNYVEKDKDIQDWLKSASEELSPERLFEAIYQKQQEYSEERINWREKLKAEKPDDEPSTLDDPAKAQEYYDNKAKEATVRAMRWLEKEIPKKDSKGERREKS